MKLFEQSYYNTFNKLQELIDKFVPGDIIISFDQMKDFYNRMTDDTYVSFVALTHYRDWEYWKSSASQYWLNGNKDLIRRQKKVERTFVVESKEVLLTNIDLIDIIKGQIKEKIKINILVEDGEVRDFFNNYTYSDKTTGLEKFRLGYVIYDEKYVSFWIEDIEIEDEAKYEKRKLIIKLDKETVDKYNEMNYRFGKKSFHFDNLTDFEKWLE